MIAKLNRLRVLFWAGTVIGAIMFLLIYGGYILNPTYDDWLLNATSDSMQHYLGWKFYRKSDWYFPIGLTDGLIENQTVSCIYTDCIPLFAVFFKFISPILPVKFQYFGFWKLFCFCMQGGLASVILFRLSKKALYSLISTPIYVVFPSVLQRMDCGSNALGHEALGGQWIILLALFSWVYQNYEWRKTFTPVLVWGVCAFLAAQTHIYFIPMIFIIMLGYIITDIANKNFLRPFLCFIIASTFTLVSLFVLGAFHNKTTFNSVGLGFFSANYNTFINPLSYSVLLPSLRSKFYQQYEGFAYVGVGIILAGIYLILQFLIERFMYRSKPTGQNEYDKNKTNTNRIIALIIATLSLAIAASPQGTSGTRLIYSLTLPDTVRYLFEIFRCTGRFAWVSAYIIVTGILYGVSKINFKKDTGLLYVAVLLTVIQMFDLSNVMRAQFIPPNIHYHSTLTNSLWNKLGESSDKILFAGITQQSVTRADIYYEFAEFADKYDITLSSFAVSRMEYEQIYDHATYELEKINSGAEKKNVIVVFLNDEFPQIKTEYFTCIDIDGYKIGLNSFLYEQLAKSV